MSKLKETMAVLLVICLFTGVFAGFVSAAQKTGWQQVNGGWYYYNTDGSVKTGWLKDGGSWYYLNQDSFDMNYGQMVAGQAAKANGKAYLFNTNGKLISTPGWQKVNGKYYYVKNDGTCETGWVKYNGKWYGFFREDSSLCINEVASDQAGNYYCFDKSGVLSTKTGWIQIPADENGTLRWYYLESGGRAKTGWFKSGKNWYYFNPVMVTGVQLVSRTSSSGEQEIVLYYFNDDGTLSTKAGLKKITSDYIQKTYWVYVNADGTCITGWVKSNGNWYYFSPMNGMLYMDGEKLIQGKWYTFDANGVCIG